MIWSEQSPISLKTVENGRQKAAADFGSQSMILFDFTVTFICWWKNARLLIGLRRRHFSSTALCYVALFCCNFIWWDGLLVFSKISTNLTFSSGFIFFSTITRLLCSQGLQISDYLLIVSALSILSIWLPLFYLLCDFGENVSIASGQLDGALFGHSWYLCPNNIQRCFMIMMMLAQKPVYMEGFARLYCSRETFKSVILPWSRPLFGCYGWPQKWIRFCLNFTGDEFGLHILYAFTTIWVITAIVWSGIITTQLFSIAWSWS